MEKFLAVLIKWFGISVVISIVVFIFGLIQEKFVSKGLLDWIFDDGGIWFCVVGFVGLFVYLYSKE